MTSFLQSEGQLLASQPRSFSSSEQSVNLHSPSYLGAVCVISLLVLQHKLSGSCGGELVSGALPSLPWDSETSEPASVFSFSICEMSEGPVLYPALQQMFCAIVIL